MKKQAYPGIEGLYQLALEAGEMMRQASSSLRHNVVWKSGDNTPATLTDQEVNRLVIQWMRNSYPHLTVIGEEEWRLSDESEYVVVVDPLDGTISFMLGLPLWTFCVSVLRSGVPQVALIHDPVGRRTWAAERGKGAFLNNQRIRVSESPLAESVVSCMWWKGSVGNIADVTRQINEAGANWINTCAVAICGGLIAEGRMAGSVFGGQSAWETPAVALLAVEAGGASTDLWGNAHSFHLIFENGEPRIAPIPGHVVSNGVIQDELLAMVARANCVL